ncbi:MAG: ABC transporter permease [Polyangiaceae bacterium]|nr:ABC transporter permease [Polyangiaceae bacterium]
MDTLQSLLEPGAARDALTSNLLTLFSLLCVVGAALKIRSHPIWARAFATVLRRRRFSVIVLGLFFSVAILDSIEWVGGEGAGEDKVAAMEARSLLDRAFSGSREKSYSAPFAQEEFYDHSPLVHPGAHPLGTNILGQDVVYALLKGAKVALLIGGLTSAIAIPLALFFGMLAGYYGGRLDDIIFFVMSTLASMPSILLLVALIMALGKSTFSVCVALGVTSWVGLSRLTRGETMKLRELDYVLAARSLGVSHRRILLTHILPNLMHLVVITFVLMFSGLVLAEATLAWLGIGVDGSWGQMIAQAKDELSRQPVIWWNIGAAGVALFSLLLAVNRVGDALRDVLDPRTISGDHS